MHPLHHPRAKFPPNSPVAPVRLCKSPSLPAPSPQELSTPSGYFHPRSLCVSAAPLSPTLSLLCRSPSNLWPQHAPLFSMSQGQVQRLTAFNKLVDVENKKANRNDCNFTANALAGSHPARPWEKPAARNFISRRRGKGVSARTEGAATSCFSPPCLLAGGGGSSSFNVTAITGDGG